MVSVGHQHVRVTVVWELQVSQDALVTVPKDTLTGELLAKRVAACLESQPFERKRFLLQRVVIGGIPSMQLSPSFRNSLQELVSGERNNWIEI